MKKIFAAIVAVIVLTTTFATVLASNYVGNAKTHKFHYTDCASASKMNPANRVNFNTREDAVNAGYVPCKRCNP